ncbi:PKD domain-containing protein [Thermophagus sp. OGC60D27]|uniref:PKD domain-containing protein n=1 Tax=Thermophagus sp. OGC60D27 TaxID=3458415 RepID=UPI004037F82C
MTTTNCRHFFCTCIFFWLIAIVNLSGQEIKIEKLNISTPATSEYAPIVKDSVLFFVSNRRANLLVTYFDQNRNILYSIFNAPLFSNGNTGKIKLFSPSGQPRFNAGPITFSGNGSSLIATHNRSLRPTKKRRQNRSNSLTLYSAQKEGAVWRDFKKLKIQIPPRASAGHPSLSADGTQLFFVSNMEGGYGETDIYVSQKNKDGWSSPQNMGERINTPGKELFPFIHPSGKLYFTSDGHGGEGNLDIYFIDLDHRDSEPVPLPAPINSIYNDFSFYAGFDENQGFFASDRDGNDDIFSFTIPEIVCKDPQPIEENHFCFTFFENGPFQTDTLPYVYRWNFGDGHEAEGLETDHCFSGPGEYHIQLNVIDTLLNKELFSVASYNLKLEPKKQIWFQVPDTIKTGTVLKLEAIFQGFDEAPNHTLLTWDFGTGDTRIGEKVSYIYREAGRYRIICSTQIQNNRRICFYREIKVTNSQY